MKLLEFSAKNVHEYLDFDVTFREDVNFFAGLNGCGKTTALKLIMALLTPSLRELKSIKFESVYLQLKHHGKTYEIQVEKKKPKLVLTVTIDGESKSHSSLDPSEIDMPDWELAKRKMYIEEAEINSALVERRALPIPMFLSLARSLLEPKDIEKDYFMSLEEQVKYKRKRSPKSFNNLNEAIDLILRASSIARSNQARIDKVLRDKIIKNSLSFYPPVESMSLPDTQTIYELTRKQSAIENTLDSLNISSEEFSGHYKDFFSKISFLAKEIEEQSKEEFSEAEAENPFVREAMYEWFINQGQLKRIETIFDLVESYQERKQKIYRDLFKFETLVNNFLNETGKDLYIHNVDGPKIKIKGKTRSISILSSGESQIVCMLAHLVLNKNLQKDGVFIVDEPELSLHISWQDMFVEAVQAANPDLQVILATHSPAIIGGRNSMYVPLNGGNNV